MLYISTRNKTDSFTAHHALHSDFAPDGGALVPFHLPKLDDDFLQSMREQSFCKNVADILNLFFSKGITDWDIECVTGRKPVRIAELSGRLVVAELWHNPQGSYKQIENGIHQMLTSNGADNKPTSWSKIAIRIAIAFAVYAVLPESKIESFDVAVSVGDFTQASAAWYARKMGLPIGKIVCACNDNSAPWDLICRGEMNTGINVVKTQTPELDYACPVGLERLVFESLGITEAIRFAECVRCKLPYRLNIEEQLPQLNLGLTAAVIGQSRIDAILSSLYRTDHYIADPHCAIPVGAVQDHRARSGENRTTLLFADNSPALQSDIVASKIGISTEELKNLLQSAKEL